MAQETQYTANTGLATISTANTNLDGTGTLGTILTAGSNGTLLKSVTIKAVGTTTQNIVRFFIVLGGNTRLVQEIEIPPVTPSATDPTFEYVWRCNVALQSGAVFKGSTNNGESYNIIAEGLDWTYPGGLPRPESTQYTANTGLTQMTVANSNRDGSGTLYTGITAGASATYKGCKIDTVTFQAIVNTTHGMWRAYINDGVNSFLFREFFVPYDTKSGTFSAATRTVMLDFNLQAGYLLKFSTENAEATNVIVEGNDWKYPSNTYITNYTPASGSNTTSEEILHTLTVPANVFAAGDMMQIYASLLTTNNANNKTFKIYVNTSSALAGATQLAKFNCANTAEVNFSRLFPIVSDTSIECYGGTGTSVENEYVANTGTSAATTVPSVSAGFYVLITCTKATGTDTDTIRWSMVNRVF